MNFYGKRRIRKSLIHTAAFRAGSQAATLASYVVLVRGMPEQSFGVLNLLYALIPVIATVASLGIEQTLRRYQPEYLQTGQTGAASWLVRFAASARFGANIVLLMAIFFAWQWIAPLFKLEAYRAEFALFSVLIILYFQANILQLSLSSHMLQGYSVGMTMVLPIIKLAAYSVLAYYDDLTLANAIYTDIAGYGLMYASLAFAHKKYCIPKASNQKFTIEAAERRRLLRYAFFNNFSDTGSVLLTVKSDNFFIAALMNPVAVGAYAFYTRLNEMAAHLLPIRQFSNVIQPLFFAVPAQEAEQKIPRYFTLLLNTTLVLQWPIFAYVAIYHVEIVTVLFAGKFVEYSWLLPVVAGFSTINRIADPVTLVAQYKEKASVILLSKIFGIYNAVALLVLVPMIGLYGAAIATGTAQAMKNLFIWWHVRDTARWINIKGVILASFVIWCGVIVVCYGLKALLHVHAAWHLSVGFMLCAVATILYLRSPALSESDRALMESVLRGRERRIASWIGLIGATKR